MTGADREHGFVGPHEGRELTMMLDGTKPLSMFVDVSGSDVEIFDEEAFDRYASQGWRPDLERVIGRLLGYAAQDIERFIDRIPECQRACSGATNASDPEKPTTWDGFLETLDGLEVPPDFLDPEDRKRHQGNRPDPFEDWTE